MKAFLVTSLIFTCVYSVDLYSADPDLRCFYPHKTEQAMAEHQGCGAIDDRGQIKLTERALQQFLFPESGLGCLLVSQASEVLAFYVNEHGKTLSTLFVDNGCDYFQEGLARTHVDNKVAYFNNQLDIQITTHFDEGRSFSYAHAVVCNGPFKEEKMGEHTAVSGGQCGLINHDGKLVVPAKYALEQNEVFTLYINSHNECEPPPISKAADALCHGRRHGRMLDYHSDNWLFHQVIANGDTWLIEFIQAEEPDQTLIMEIDKHTAHWKSIIPKE